MDYPKNTSIGNQRQEDRAVEVISVDDESKLEEKQEHLHHAVQVIAQVAAKITSGHLSIEEELKQFQIEEEKIRQQRIRVSNAVSKRKARQDSIKKEAIKSSNATSKRKAKQDPIRKEAIRSANAETKRNARKDPNRRQAIPLADAKSKRRASEARQECLRHAEAVIALVAGQRSSQHLQIEEQEQIRRQKLRLGNAASKRKARQDPIQKDAIKAANAACQRKAREDPTRREAIRSANKNTKRKAREDPIRREAIRSIQAAYQQKLKKSPQRREEKKSVNTLYRRNARRDPVYRTPEKKKYNASRNERLSNPSKRKAAQAANTAIVQKRRKLEFSSYDLLLKQYNESIRCAPSYVCSCCGGLWYESSTSITSKEKLQADGCTEELITTILHVHQEVHRLCGTCRQNVKQKRVPRLCLSNGFDFPPIPKELDDLSPLEERLVALRIPFMQIRLLGCERQSALRGNVVNVENNLDICAQVLPRAFSEMSTVQVQFMRRMKYKHPYMYETVRPHKVYAAAKYMIGTELYISENVALSEDWSGFTDDVTMDFVIQNYEATASDGGGTVQENDSGAPSDVDNTVQEYESSEVDKIVQENESGLNEMVELEVPENNHNLGAEETLIFNEKDVCGIRIAPGEGKTPMHLHYDQHAEEMSFPTIYCGKIRTFKKKTRISYTDIAKSELRRYDRRACLPTKILYSFKRSFNEKVAQAIQICLRQKHGNENRLTASFVRKPEFIETLVNRDDGYAIFKNLRSSPSYWKEKTKKVMAMIRQLGRCTFFITLSAAETKWRELIVMLMKILKNRDITETEAAALTFEEIAELIRSDPVTCMRHFDYKYRALLKFILKAEGGIFAPYKVQDYFSRLEFQMRGSPHSHGLYWIKNAPIYIEGDPESEKAVVDFIDNFITCERCEEGEMENLIGYQIHKHSRTCEKKLSRGQKCRFGFPKPPMKETMILTPLSKECDPQIKKSANELYNKLKMKLDLMGRSYKENIQYEDFLESLETNHEDYILAVRSSLKRASVVLKRPTSSIFINPYNRQLLEAWGANIDIQFILDTYACAKYCVGYIMKSDGGVSKLLQAANQDARKKGSTVKNKLKQFASILINGSEISAQEACAFLLGIANTHCSKVDVFINTAPPNERVRLLKSQDELEKLSDDSEDVCYKGLIDHYTKRPEELDDMCLAEFASTFDFSKTCKGKVTNTECGNRDLDLPESILDDNAEMTVGDLPNKIKFRTFKLLDSSGFIKERARKVIRFRHYGKVQDPDNYFRERLMLFLPWRDEDKELLTINAIEKADKYKSVIFENSRPFFWVHDIDDNALNALMEELEDEEEEVGNYVPLVNEDLEALQDEELRENNLVEEIVTGKSRVEQFLPPRVINKDDYIKIMRTLNEKQRRFVLNALHVLKTKKTPFHHFVSGGAGVGKSHAITALVQSYLRYNASIPSINPDQVCVLVCAFTGKAAFNVFGMTLHTTFKLPPNQSKKKEFYDLEAGAVNTLRAKLAGVQLFIIDEISMVSVRQLYEINHRLKQIFATSEEFGNRSIIVVGHLRQLPPVGGSLVFKDPQHSTRGDLAVNYLWHKFELFELDEIMRQKGDLEFCKALNNMSEGCMDEDDVALIKSRQINSSNQPPHEAIRLYATNAQCQEYNSKVHAILDTEWDVSTAYDKIQGNGTEAQKKAQQEYAKTLTREQSDGLPYQTRLQVGGEYFVSTNVDVQDGLFNGSTGSLKMIQHSFTPKNIRIPTRVWMDFRNPLIGTTSKSRTKAYQISKNINEDWVSIERTTRNLSKNARTGDLQIIRTQIPLVAANGMTINKAQGSSLPLVVVNVSPSNGRKLTRELLYVGCSRATSCAGLFIDGEFEAPSAPPPDDPVTLEMTRLRTNPVKFALKFLQDFDDQYEKIFFHNVQSFGAHHLDVVADHCAMSSNILAFVEPHLLITDNIDISDFTCIHRTNCRAGRNSEGSLIFAKGNITLEESPTAIVKEFTNNGHCIFIKWKVSGIIVVMIYKSPKYPNDSFRRLLNEQLGILTNKILVFGDININLQNEGKSVLSIFEKYGLKTKLSFQDASTDGGSHIDCCFSNVLNLTAWFYESYYSYHKPICIIWPKYLM